MSNRFIWPHISRRSVPLAGMLLLAALASGCASAPSRVASAYCVNARGAALAPENIPAARCTNLPDGIVSAPVTAMPTAPAGGPLRLASNVDLNRYMGRWYVIANIPYFFEKGNVGAYVEYQRKGDGIIDRYFAHPHDFSHAIAKTSGHGYVVAGTHDAEWRVTFFWPIYVTYPILYVSPDYQYALVGYPGRSLGWVFARKPLVSNARLRALLARFAAQGYDISKFRRVPQTSAQLAGHD